jgi:acetyl esterase
MEYDFDPELAQFAAGLPVPQPASPTSGIADAVAARELNVAFFASIPDLTPDLTGLEVVDLAVPGPTGAPDVPIRLYRPEPRSAEPIPGIVSIHGGGFSNGSIYLGDTGAAHLARQLGAVVIDIEYRLAPEHRAPAAVEDCYAALSWFHNNATDLTIDPARIMISGASAGGGIAAGLALYARDHGGPPICFQFLAYPELDDRLETPSMRQFDDTPLWNRHAAEQSWRWYLGGVSGDDISPYAAPPRATSHVGLPPAYISVMEFDPLRDEGINYALQLLAAGVSVELHLFAGTFHGSALAHRAMVSKREQRERLEVLRRALEPAGE